jgi:hypothetical protein
VPRGDRKGNGKTAFIGHLRQLLAQTKQCQGASKKKKKKVGRPLCVELRFFGRVL